MPACAGRWVPRAGGPRPFPNPLALHPSYASITASITVDITASIPVGITAATPHAGGGSSGTGGRSLPNTER
jgi:hypothetical protein